MRRHLSLLLGATVLPLLLFSGVVVWRLASEMRSHVEHRLLTSAREMSATLDHEAQATIAALSVLARSPSLDVGDLAGFRAEAAVALRMHPSWLTVILLGPDGRQLVNLSAPMGAPALLANDAVSFHRVLDGAAAHVGSLKRRRHGDGATWAFPVRVPVVRGGQVRYVLSAVIPAESVEALLARPNTEAPDEFTRTVVDADGTVVYRGRSPERYVGSRATGNFVANTAASAEGIFRSVTLDGLESFVAFSRSPRNGWVSAVVVPRSLIEGPMRKALGALGVFALAALVFTAAGAVVLSARFRKGTAALEAAGRVLAEGKPPPIRPSGIRELDQLGDSLAASAALLQERAHERDLHLSRAEEAVRARDEFLSLASHELKTPLTSLLLHARILESGLASDDAQLRQAARRFIEQAVKQTGRLGRLVDDMLDISRISAGRMSLDREPFDLAELVEETVARLRPTLEAAGCEVTVAVDGPVRGEWDRFRMDQVLSNLLTNAARYGPGAPVHVSVGAFDGQAVLKVRDHGRGIPKDDLHRIFEKFERLVEPGEVAGLGLGLFIVREVVLRHGGTVGAESELGQGAVFTVTVPVRVSEAGPRSTNVFE